MSGIHVYLGPSLDRDKAKQLLPDACYHPPVRCGDLISLLRLGPKQVIIIDGYYETVPAAWHKEILLVMELGVAVFGAASIGALRAAELYQFGMQGLGLIYHDFKSGVLTDDDEVAVLHANEQNGFMALNDPMVNIRYTCCEAVDKKIISTAMKEHLIAYCKEQFYPYRSLMKAAIHLKSDYPDLGDTFIPWLNEHGLVDIKRQDAITVLRHCADNDHANVPKVDYQTPMTMFLRNTTYYANLTPFNQNLEGLPEIEKQLQSLYHDSIEEYRLVAELAHFSRCLFSLLTEETLLIDEAPLKAYIKAQRLYSPEPDFSFYKTHFKFSGIYALVSQAICLGHITEEKVAEYLPCLAHYYDLTPALIKRNKSILRILIILLFSIELKFDLCEVTLTSKQLKDQMRSLFVRRAYSKEKRESWSFPEHIEKKAFYNFLSKYFKVTTVYYPESPEGYYYFKWIQDAYHCYASLVSFPTHSLADELVPATEGAG